MRGLAHLHGHASRGDAVRQPRAERQCRQAGGLHLCERRDNLKVAGCQRGTDIEHHFYVTEYVAGEESGDAVFIYPGEIEIGGASGY